MIAKRQSGNSRSGNRQSGQATLIALLAAVLLLTALALVAIALGMQGRLLLAEDRDVRLTALADAGLAKALAKLSVSPSYSGEEEEFGGGHLEIGAVPVGYRLVAVTVVARYRGLRRAVRAEVEIPPKDPPRVRRWESLGTGRQLEDEDRAP